MSNVSTKKVFVESVAEQQEHFKNQRNALKILQQQSGVVIDKENLAGRPQFDKLSRLKAATDATLASTEYAKRKRVDTRIAETQTSPQKQATDATAATAQNITVADLTSESQPSELYWQKLAEKRREALEETLAENQHLHERIDGLETELNTSRQMLDEARNLVQVLTEMLNENEAEKEMENAGDDNDDDDDDDGSVTKSSNDGIATVATQKKEDSQTH